MISYIVDSLLKPMHEFIRKVQFHCKSKCCAPVGKYLLLYFKCLSVGVMFMYKICIAIYNEQ